MDTTASSRSGRAAARCAIAPGGASSAFVAARIAGSAMPLASSSRRIVSSSSSGADASWQRTIALASRSTPRSARPPPRPSLAPWISPGISTSWTSTPRIRVSAGTGRVVVNAYSPVLICTFDSAWSSDDLPLFGAPTRAICAAPSRRTAIESRWTTRLRIRVSSTCALTHLRISAYGPLR